MLTRLEVLDDAIKIGLGTAIALTGVVLTNRHQKKTEIRRRRLDAIQSAANELTRHSAVFVQLQATYGSFLKLKQEQPDYNRSNPLPGVVDSVVRGSVWSEVQKLLASEVGQSLVGLSTLHAQLAVIGAHSSAQTAQEYTKFCAAMQSAAKLPDSIGEARDAEGKFNMIVAKWASSRQSLLDALARDFGRS